MTTAPQPTPEGDARIRHVHAQLLVAGASDPPAALHVVATYFDERSRVTTDPLNWLQRIVVLGGMRGASKWLHRAADRMRELHPERSAS